MADRGERTESDWRMRARGIIVPVLDSLPPGSGPREMRKAVHDLYPFGERAMWPYKMWCKELKHQIDARMKPREAVPEIVFVLTTWPEQGARGAWIDVSCGWCLSPKLAGFFSGTHGCMMCARHQRLVEAVVKLPEWKGFKQAIRDDVSSAALVGDWLEEIGMGRVEEEYADLLFSLANVFRLEGNKVMT